MSKIKRQFVSVSSKQLASLLRCLETLLHACGTFSQPPTDFKSLELRHAARRILKRFKKGEFE